MAPETGKLDFTGYPGLGWPTTAKISENSLKPKVFQMLFNGLTITFIKEFLLGLWLTLPLLLSLMAFIIVLGQIVGKKERWLPFESFYWSFITATTIGYGDIRPTRGASRVLSIVIGFAGLVFSGILVAVAVHSATIALAAHDAAIKVAP